MTTEDDFSILIVDDDEVDRLLVRRAMKQNRFTNDLYETRHGEEALRFLRNEREFQDPKEAPKPGLILLDLNMPVMNGLELLSELKMDAKLRTIPVVILTTSDAETDLVEGYSLGVAGYIVKPVDFLKFAGAVHAIGMYWTLCRKAG